MMDTLFFVASKLIWALLSPDSLLVVLWGLGVGLVYWGRLPLGKALLGLSFGCTLVIALLPVGDWLALPLESRFEAAPSLPSEVDGIIVLGGFLDPRRSDVWQQVQTNEADERWQHFTALARRYPEAQLVFTGGSGRVLDQQRKEAAHIETLMAQAGLGERLITLETESRNTWENVVNSQALVTPAPGSHWLLITSAAHMPRAVGIFCARQWPVMPVPVDFRSDPAHMFRPEWEFAEHVNSLTVASREWVGLVAYFLSGRTSQFLPGAATPCLSR